MFLRKNCSSIELDHQGFLALSVVGQAVYIFVRLKGKYIRRGLCAWILWENVLRSVTEKTKSSGGVRFFPPLRFLATRLFSRLISWVLVLEWLLLLFLTTDFNKSCAWKDFEIFSTVAGLNSLKFSLATDFRA